MNQVSDIIKSELLNLDKIQGVCHRKPSCWSCGVGLCSLRRWPLTLRMGLFRPLNQQPNLSYLGLKHQAQAQILGIQNFLNGAIKSKQRFKKSGSPGVVTAEGIRQCPEPKLDMERKNSLMSQLFTYVCPLSMDRFQKTQGNNQDVLVTHGTKQCPQTHTVHLFVIFQQFGSVMRKKKRVYSLITLSSGHPSNYPPPQWPPRQRSRNPTSFPFPFLLQEPAHWL